MGYLTSHVVASMGLVDVSAAPGTRARAFMNEIERLLLVGTPLLEDMCLILCARLSLVEWDLANKTVAGFAHAAGENVASACACHCQPHERCLLRFRALAASVPLQFSAAGSQLSR